MPTSRDVIIRLPGPPGNGDVWGARWEEFNNSPGPAYIRAKPYTKLPNGDLEIEIEGQIRSFQPDDDLTTDYTYKFLGNVKHSVIASLKTALSNVTGTTAVTASANTLIKILNESITQQDLIDLINVINNTQNDDVKLNAILLLGIVITSEI